MDFSDLFEILAKHLNFTLDFLGFGGMSAYKLEGEISTDLVSFVLASLSLMLLFGRLRMDSLRLTPRLNSVKSSTAHDPEDITNDSKTDKPIEGSAIVGLLFAFLAIGMLTHLGIAIYASIHNLHHPRISWISLFEIGNFKDTVNGSFAYMAATGPIIIVVFRALSNRANRFSNGILITAVVGTWAYFIHGLSAAHGLGFWTMVLPVITSFAVIAGLTLLTSWIASRCGGIGQ